MSDTAKITYTVTVEVQRHMDDLTLAAYRGPDLTQEPLTALAQRVAEWAIDPRMRHPKVVGVGVVVKVEVR